jgi:hypothetical protein
MLPYSVIHTIAWEMPGHDFVLEKKKREMGRVPTVFLLSNLTLKFCLRSYPSNKLGIT